MKPNIGIEQERLQKICSILNKVLADNAVLYVKTQNYHWHIEGVHFRDLHKFFEEQYEELIEDRDEIAERIRSLGGIAIGSMKEFLENSSIKESKGGIIPAEEMLKNLLHNHESIIKDMRTYIEETDRLGDTGSADFLTGLIQKHEKSAWMIRSILSGMMDSRG
jgi:starvation-inducible DNA-binding protein